MMKVEKLNDDQREVYCNIKEWLKNERGTVITIDAPSGTGKTTVLSLLAAEYDNSTEYIVFRKDQASELEENTIKGYTYVSYNMHHFDLPYHNAIKMFDMVNLNNIDVLYKLIKYSLQYKKIYNDISTIILDTYTIASPAMLLLLYIILLRKDINLIFAGSKLQQGAISKLRLHNRNNYYIIQILSDLTVTKLTRNMRSHNDNFQNKLSCFCEMLQNRNPEGDVQFHFELRYLLYCLFRSKYFTEERFDTLYMSQYHHDITARLFRYIDYLKSNKTDYVIEPFIYGNDMKWQIIHTVRRDRKFFPGLLLVKGCRYVYITKAGAHKIVELEQMVYKNNNLDTLVVRLVNQGTVVEIQRCPLNYYQILPAYRTWLLPTFAKEEELWQFPLRIYSLTYHAALGQTINSAQVEISADGSNANSVYVGLCCVTSDAAIHKIHANQDLLSFVVTDYMENERQNEKFYYRCPKEDPNRNEILEYAFTKGTKKIIDKIKWTTVNSIIEFESKKSNGYLRIPRTFYNQSKNEKTTSLMKVTQFVKTNPSVVLATMEAINNETVNDQSKNKKSKDVPKKSPAYILLEKAYNSWKADNDESKK